MDPARYARVKDVFFEARELPAPERETFLDAACGADAGLRAEVASLLSHDVEAPLIDSRPPTLPGEAPPPADPADPLALVGAVLDERYRVDAYVAEGGFGYVYRAWHVRWSRPVAVKVFKPQLSVVEAEELKQAFIKEGALLNELSRKTTAIVQSYDVGTFIRPDGTPLLFTVLEWLEGRSLHEEARATPGPWPLVRVLATLAPVAEALAVAHASGVAHRDVKPRNIMLGESAKLLDFGVAKVAAERGRGFQSTGGKLTAFTVDYAAPEQISKMHGPTGPWTDVHALALVCVELLAGRHPLGEVDVVKAMARLRDPARRPTPRTAGVEVSDAVEAVFAKALAVEPSERFQDVGAFFTALRDAAAAPAPPRRAPGAWALWGAAVGVVIVVWALLR